MGEFGIEFNKFPLWKKVASITILVLFLILVIMVIIQLIGPFWLLWGPILILILYMMFTKKPIKLG